nr:MAG TPA: hypothetical protein [Caudoviricetes sp.]
MITCALRITSGRIFFRPVLTRIPNMRMRTCTCSSASMIVLRKFSDRIKRKD